ncbi:HAMP domain-containing histidine kinase [Clostridium sp. PL3]|uniref:histidine kinase n=1 Tax=Clostridium thailandense TaxID=2794346 RepID=A0A949TWZ6_9CLOT|nr:HAMP domain-containing sensor histidine kinase [Clostridium thailandense]MBV7272473.1 HAMP domain-containing histidine kinase [Clostridium thailandense]
MFKIRRKSKKVYTSMFQNYLLFVFLIILVFIAGVSFPIFGIGRMITSQEYIGEMQQFYMASKIVKSDYKSIDASKITSVGGWVEILDSDRNLIHVIGKKKDDKKAYTEAEMYELMNWNLDVSKIGNENLNSITPFYSEGKKYYCIVKVPPGVIKIEISRVNEPQKYIEKAAIHIVIGMLIILVFLIIVILFYAFWTSRKIVKPLNKILEGIKKMTEGDYSTRINFKAANEFAQIKDAFNFMAEKIQASELEREKVERLKQQFFVDISHDLKTPVSSVQGYSKALYDGVVVDEDKKRLYLKTIYEKSQRVTSLIENIHELAKLNNDTYIMYKERIDICEFMRELVVEFYPEIENRNFEFIIDIPEYAIEYEFDKNEMSRAISNIISNALKYNPDYTTLKIELEKKLKSIEIIIADNGVGIEEGLKEQIFEAFTRGDLSRKTSGGTGIGLSIAYKIIEKHGGKLYLESEQDFKTAFVIQLKLL